MPLDHSKYHPAHDPRFMHFPSRRSTVFSTKGMIACSQPLGTPLRFSPADVQRRRPASRS